MHTGETEPVVALDDAECWSLLSRVNLGRLTTAAAYQPDIVPVNFAVQRHTILIRSAAGTKLANVAANSRVAFEAEDHDDMTGWSVVVKGVARVVSTSDELAEAQRTQLLPWTATLKDRYIRIVPTRITGRRFAFGAEAGEWFNLD